MDRQETMTHFQNTFHQVLQSKHKWCFVSDFCSNKYIYLIKLNVSENRRGNQEWTIQMPPATLVTQDTGRRQNKYENQNTIQKTEKMRNRDLIKTRGRIQVLAKGKQCLSLNSTNCQYQKPIICPALLSIAQLSALMLAFEFFCILIVVILHHGLPFRHESYAILYVSRLTSQKYKYYDQQTYFEMSMSNSCIFFKTCFFNFYTASCYFPYLSLSHKYYKLLLQICILKNDFVERSLIYSFIANKNN